MPLRYLAIQHFSRTACCLSLLVIALPAVVFGQAQASSGDLPSELKRALFDHKEALKVAREKLLVAFDTAQKKVKQQRRLSAQDRSELLDAVDAEKTRFEKAELYPWSEPMRDDFLKYLKAVKLAEADLSREFNREIEKTLKSGDEARATDLRRRLESITAPKPVAHWVHSAIANPDVVITMYSDGKFTDRDGAARCEWTFNNGVLVTKWPLGGGGIGTDTVRVAPDGLSYFGQNNNGVVISGKYHAK